MAWKPGTGSRALKTRSLRERFVREYVKDFNATRAIIRAGYTGSDAKQRAYLLKKEPWVQNQIERFAAKISDDTVATAKHVLEQASAIATSDLRDLFDDEGQVKPLAEIPPNLAKAISSIDITERTSRTGEVEVRKKIRLWDKNTALTTMAKLLNMVADTTVRHEVSGTVVHEVTRQQLDSMSTEELEARRQQIVTLLQGMHHGPQELDIIDVPKRVTDGQS